MKVPIGKKAEAVLSDPRRAREIIAKAVRRMEEENRAARLAASASIIAERKGDR